MSDIALDQKQLENLRNFLDLDKKQRDENILTVLLKGREGSGKTSFLGTCPGPILIDHFDTSGTQSIRSEIEQGNILVRRWYDKDNGYQSWSEQWEKDLKSGFYKIFNTVSWDSGTSLVELMGNQVVQDDPKSPISGLGGKTINLQKFTGMYNVLMNHIGLTILEVPIFILTFHTKITQDELTNEITYELATYPQLQTRIPMQFAEKWTTVAEPNGEHKIYTGRKGRERASTQIGRDKFDLVEKPDMKYLLDKAKIKVSEKPNLSDLLK